MDLQAEASKVAYEFGCSAVVREKPQGKEIAVHLTFYSNGVETHGVLLVDPATAHHYPADVIGGIREMAKKMRSAAMLPPGTRVYDLTSECPDHPGCHITMMDTHLWVYACSHGGATHQLPWRIATYSRADGQHVILTQPDGKMHSHPEPRLHLRRNSAYDESARWCDAYDESERWCDSYGHGDTDDPSEAGCLKCLSAVAAHGAEAAIRLDEILGYR